VPWSDDFTKILDSVVKKFKNTPSSVLLQTSAGKTIDSSNFHVFKGEHWHAFPHFATSGEFQLEKLTVTRVFG
jgi:hypothetical protein